MLRRRTETQAGRTLARLYQEHATATYRFALHLTRSQADAEDLLQTAFLEAHRLLLRGEELVKPRAWLARVVRTRALNLCRDRHDIPIGDDIDTTSGIADPVESHDQLRRVRAMLWALPEAQHQAFVMRHWSGLSNREIAQVLDTTEAAVESLLVRARRALLAAEDIAPACVEYRTRLADGFPETPAMHRHRHTCQRCTAAGQRLAGAAGIAGVLLLAPRASVAHALAATVPGFTASTATATTTCAATATKAAITKTAVTILAISTTAAALHTGRVHLPNIPADLHLLHATRADAAEGRPAPSAPAHLGSNLVTATIEHEADHPTGRHPKNDPLDHATPDNDNQGSERSAPTTTTAPNQDPPATTQQNQNTSGNQDDQAQNTNDQTSPGENQDAQGSTGPGSTNNTDNSGSPSDSSAENTDASGNANASDNQQ